MIDFLSKRATAAHLALAAVAPLVFCKYLAAGTTCSVLAWIAGFCALWAFMAPVRYLDERSPEARLRFLGHTMSDPFFWALLLLTVYGAIVALNSGVGFGYDAEQKLWSLRQPAWPELPGGVEGACGIYFASSILALVIYPAVAHSLDTRQAVYFAIFASFTVVIDMSFALAAGFGVRGDSATAYGLWALVSASAMFSAEHSRRRPKEMISAISLAGCFSALLLSGRPVVACIFIGATLLLALVFSSFMVRELGFVGIARALLLVLVAAGIAAMVFLWLSGDWESLLPVWRSEVDTVLDRFAIESWRASPWTGSGVGSFPLVVNASATADDWVSLGPIPDFSGGGWRIFLVERGMVGLIAVAVALGTAVFMWFRYARQRGLEKFAAAVPVFPIALVAVGAALVFDSSALQAEAIVAFAALAAFSVNGGQ